MTQKAMTKEILNMLKQIKQAAQSIKEIQRDLYCKQLRLKQAVVKYEAGRIELVKRELRSRGLTWCTVCAEEIWRSPQIISEHSTKLLLLEGKEEWSSSHHEGGCGFRDFSRLHRACRKCYKKAFDKHGSHGAYNTSEKDQSSFYAFKIEQREDGYYAYKFGQFTKLETGKYKLPNPPTQFAECLISDWDLPPRIKLDYENCELVIHEGGRNG